MKQPVALGELAHAQANRCAICLMKSCSKEHIVDERVVGLLCCTCHQLVTDMSYMWLKQEYAAARQMEKEGSKPLNDPIILRWALEYMEEIEGIGPDE